MTPMQQLARADFAIDPDVMATLLTPLLMIDEGAVRGNIKTLLRMAGEPDRTRPHLKTTKSPHIWSTLVEAGIRHFKCATVREARVFCAMMTQRSEQVDLLVAYPHTQPAVDRLTSLDEQHDNVSISLAMEDTDAIEALGETACGVFIDLDCGMHRTGVPLDDTPRILDLARAAGTRFRGLHMYEGHIRDVSIEVRRQRCIPLYRELNDVARTLAEHANERPIELVTSGTPAFPVALEFEGFRTRSRGVVHRVSPGTIIFHDGRSEALLPNGGFEASAAVLSRVISCPRSDIITCDCGSKAVAAEVGDPCVDVVGRPDLIPQHPSEEHMPIRVDSGPVPVRGDVLTLVPQHICPTVNLAGRALLRRSDRSLEWMTLCAAGHDTT